MSDEVDNGRVVEQDGVVYIVVGVLWLAFPAGTTREHAESVLAEAQALVAPN